MKNRADRLTPAERVESARRRRLNYGVPVAQRMATLCYKPDSDVRDAVLERDAYTCQACGATRRERRIEVTHIVPWPEGETHIRNLRALCTSCNLRERRRWGGNVGLPVPAHPISVAGLRAIMERALARPNRSARPLT